MFVILYVFYEVEKKTKRKEDQGTVGWALIYFLGCQGGRLFEVGAYWKVGGLSNKYGEAPSGFEFIVRLLYILPQYFVNLTQPIGIQKAIFYGICTCTNNTLYARFEVFRHC